MAPIGKHDIVELRLTGEELGVLGLAHSITMLLIAARQGSPMGALMVETLVPVSVDELATTPIEVHKTLQQRVMGAAGIEGSPWGDMPR